MTLKPIPPLSFPRSLLFFGLPLLLMILMFWGLGPLMDLMGVRLFITFLVTWGGPLLLLFLLSLRFYRKEGHPWNWQAFRERFRLHRMRPVDWIWTVGLAVFMFGSGQLLSFTYTWVADFFPEPKILIRMFAEDANYFMEVPLKRNWLLLAGMFAFLACNVLGEEFWWRGYILPRQELVHGKWTWLIHGLLWNTVHLFLPWELIKLLPGTLALPFVIQRLRNTWPGIIAHFAVNITGWWMLISGIMS